MKHFSVRLSDHRSQTRQWGIWSDHLTIGSDPRCDLVLPTPAPALAAVLHESGSLETPFGLLEVVEDTPRKMDLWDRATARIHRSRLLGWREPGAGNGRLRTGILAGLGMFSVLAMTGMVWFYQGVPKPVEAAEIEVILPLVEVTKAEEKKPEPVVVQKEDRGTDVPKPTPQGGALEARTVPWPPSSPSSVMHNSAMDRLSTAGDGLLGEDVDVNEKNMVDVVLAGGGGHLRQGDRGGHGASGDGDRKDGVGGIGLGNGGRASVGPGDGGRKGPLSVGLNQAGHAKTRGIVAAPRPNDIELGTDAGSRSAESILRVIRQHIGGFQFSYQKYLRDNPNLGGRISVRFTIAPSGDVVAISIVDSNTGNTELDGDIKEKARRMKFDQIEKGNVTVTYAFVLDRQ